MNQDKRVVDLLVKTKIKGEDGLIIVHVEAQSAPQANFYQRMFHYFSRLYEKYQRRILPIAIFSNQSTHSGPESLQITFPFFHVLSFHFFNLELANHNWREFIKKDNPAAAALLSQMGYNEKEKVEVKLECLRMIARLEIDPARADFLANLFESYLTLNAEEEATLQQEIQKLPKKEETHVMKIETYRTRQWKMEGKEEGRREGEEKGKMEGKHEEKAAMLISFLQARFPDEVTEKAVTGIQVCEEVDTLEKIQSRLFKADTWEEVETALQALED